MNRPRKILLALFVISLILAVGRCAAPVGAHATTSTTTTVPRPDRVTLNCRGAMVRLAAGGEVRFGAPGTVLSIVRIAPGSTALWDVQVQHPHPHLLILDAAGRHYQQRCR